jgi:DNA-binding beta-propeller fold protein YncE
MNTLFTILLALNTWHVGRTISIGGEGGWDYINADHATHRIYVSHGNEVDVLDETSGGHVGTITNLSGVHGIAIAHDLGRGYISNGRSSTVTVFDLKTLKSIGEWKATGDNPDSIMYANKRVYTFNGRGKNVTVFDATNGSVVATIALDGKPEEAKIEGNRLFVNLEDKGEIAVIDLKSHTVATRWKMTDCEEPTGLALDAAHHRLYATCSESKKLAVVDTATGHTVMTVPIGSGVDGCAFDAEKHLIFASAGEGVLTIINAASPSKYEVVGNVPTMRGARTISIDPTTHHVFLPTAKFGTPAKEGARPPVVPGTFMVLEVEP